MKRNCREFRRLLSLDMDGEIAGEGPDRLRAHLDACAGCRAEHRLWLRIRDVIREEEAAAGGSVAARVLTSLRERRESTERLLPFVRRVAAAAALLIVASTAALLALGPKSAPAPTSVAPRASELAHSIILDRAGDEAIRLVDDEGVFEMMHLKSWLVTALVLAFLAGGGAGLVADRVFTGVDPDRRSTDVDGFVKVFRSRIGDVTDDQERAIRAEYERYMLEVDRVTRNVIEENRERFREVRMEWVRRVQQQLDGDQRTLWQEKTGALLAPGPSDPDADETVPPDGDGETGGK